MRVTLHTDTLTRVGTRAPIRLVFCHKNVHEYSAKLYKENLENGKEKGEVFNPQICTGTWVTLIKLSWTCPVLWGMCVYPVRLRI